MATATPREWNGAYAAAYADWQAKVASKTTGDLRSLHGTLGFHLASDPRSPGLTAALQAVTEALDARERSTR